MSTGVTVQSFDGFPEFSGTDYRRERAGVHMKHTPATVLSLPGSGAVGKAPWRFPRRG